MSGVRRLDSEAIRNAGTLAAPDYADSFALGSASDARSAEQWARASLEEAPLVLRWFLLVG